MRMCMTKHILKGLGPNGFSKLQRNICFSFCFCFFCWNVSETNVALILIAFIFHRRSVSRHQSHHKSPLELPWPYEDWFRPIYAAATLFRSDNSARSYTKWPFWNYSRWKITFHIVMFSYLKPCYWVRTLFYPGCFRHIQSCTRNVILLWGPLVEFVPGFFVGVVEAEVVETIP